MVAVIDLQISNLSSVTNALHFLGIEHAITRKASDVAAASHLILPGVGTFEAGIEALERQNIKDTVIRRVVDDHTPILGICLGMQLFFEESAESPGVRGLCLLEGHVAKLIESDEYNIPRIGWAESAFVKRYLSVEKQKKADFYYLHSYHAVPSDPAMVTITSGNKNKIVAAFQKDNIYGMQFHPEKSHIAGLRLLKSFCMEAA